MPLPARNPSTNAAPVGGRRARRQRPAEAGLDRRRRPPAGVVQQPGRPALDEAVDAAGRSASCSSTGGQLVAPGRVVDDGERRLDGAHPLDHRPGARRRRGPRRPAPSPATTRTTSSSNTTRSAGRVGAADVAVAQRAGQRAEGVHQLGDVRRPGRQLAEHAHGRAAAASRQVGEQRQLDRRGGVGEPCRAAPPARRAATSPPPRPSCRGRPARRRAPTARAPTPAATSRGTCPLEPRPSSSVPHGTPSATRRCSRCERRSPFGVRRSSSTVRGVGRPACSRAARWAAARSRASGTCGASGGTSPMASPTTSSSTHEREPAEHGVGGVEHLGEAGPRPPPQRGERRRRGARRR